MWHWLLVPFAYFLGSLSSAVITSRLMGLPDPREEGSKNPGATNVLRLGGKKAAIFTLLGDLLKGVAPLLVAKVFSSPNDVLALVGIAAFLGHLYPLFFGFKGGKGAATALGVLAGYSWLVGLFALITWLTVAYLSRISSLAALTAAALAPVFVWFVLGSPVLTGSTVLMCSILFWRHRSNIQRILRGEESKIGT